MSFGYGVGDIITVSTLAWKVIQRTRQALGQYNELTREVTSLHIVLKKLQAENTKPESWLHKIEDSERQDLESIVNGCSHVLQDLDQLLDKYGALRSDQSSVTKLWQRVRFGTGELQDLSQIRMQVTSQSSSLALLLHLMSLGSSGRVERQMAQQSAMQQQILDVAGSANIGNRESTLTTYENDDKGFWKTFRRDLIAEGWSSEVMARHKDDITAYIMELGSEGSLDIGNGLQVHQPSVATDHSGGLIAQSMDRTSIDTVGLSLDLENEAVRSQIYTRVLASASARNSIQSLSNNPASGHEPQFLDDSARLPLRHRTYNTTDMPSVAFSEPSAAMPSQADTDILVTRQPQVSSQAQHSDSTEERKDKPVRSKRKPFDLIQDYKIVVTGGGGVEKSALVFQLIQSDVRHEYEHRKICVIDEELALLDVFDTAGQEEYSAMREQYMRGGEGFMLVYSITSRQSFEEIMTFRQQILRLKGREHFPMIIVGNKCDLENERQVSKQEGEALARSFGCPFIESSPGGRINVDNAFFDLAREIRKFRASEKAREVEGWQERVKKLEEGMTKVVPPPSGSLRQFLQRGRRTT